MPLSRAVAFFLSLFLLVPAVHAADPVTYQELSLLVRSGQTAQDIVNETARRNLLRPLTPEQETALRKQGASDALLTALRTPSLLATPEQAEAYLARRAPKLASPPPVAPAAAPVAPPIKNPFPAGLEAAKKAEPRVMRLSDAYRLDELPQAMVRAQAEHKPLGFIMVWGSLFDSMAFSPRFATSGPGLVHFYEAFKDSLVLVFVRHETELKKVPPAVKAGFEGPDEGGYAPNMAVVDATASEFIVEIPLGGPKATGVQRDAIFQTGADKIYEWLLRHPTASSQPPLPQP